MSIVGWLKLHIGASSAALEAWCDDHFIREFDAQQKYKKDYMLMVLRGPAAIREFDAQQKEEKDCMLRDLKGPMASTA